MLYEREVRVKTMRFRLYAVVVSLIVLGVSTASCGPPLCWNRPHDWYGPFWSPFAWFPFGLFGIALYFLPTILAATRRKRNMIGIILVNSFTGWTFIGWVVALVWSLTPDRKPA